MPSDAERWRFLADHELTPHTDGGITATWCTGFGSAGPGPSPDFHPVSNGATADEAIDRAMERYNGKHERTIHPA